MSTPIIAAGVVAWRGNEVLLIKRGTHPLKGEWSLPGGRLKPGETIRECALRELQEETGLEGRMLGLVDVVDANYLVEGKPYQLVLVDFAVTITGGTLRSGDDAADARWFAENELESLGLWTETLRVIRSARFFF